MRLKEEDMWRRAIKVGGARVDRAAKEANVGARALPIIRVLDMSSTRALSGDRAPPTIASPRHRPTARSPRHRLHTRNKNDRRLLLNRARRTGCAAHRCCWHSRRTAPLVVMHSAFCLAASTAAGKRRSGSLRQGLLWRGLLLARAARICRRGDCLRPCPNSITAVSGYLAASGSGQMAGCATTICSSLPITARSATRRPSSSRSRSRPSRALPRSTSRSLASAACATTRRTAAASIGASSASRAASRRHYSTGQAGGAREPRRHEALLGTRR